MVEVLITEVTISAKAFHQLLLGLGCVVFLLTLLLIMRWQARHPRPLPPALPPAPSIVPGDVYEYTFLQGPSPGWMRIQLGGFYLISLSILLGISLFDDRLWLPFVANARCVPMSAGDWVIIGVGAIALIGLGTSLIGRPRRLFAQRRRSVRVDDQGVSFLRWHAAWSDITGVEIFRRFGTWRYRIKTRSRFAVINWKVTSPADIMTTPGVIAVTAGEVAALVAARAQCEVTIHEA